MKKVFAAAVGVLTAALLAAAAWLVVDKDREGPVISIDGEELIWSASMSKEELLEGVTAQDEVEGDVTDSLVVESVQEDSRDPGCMIVTYAAKDSNNNVTKLTRRLEKAASETDSEESDKDEAEEPEAEDAPADSENADDGNASGDETANAENTNEEASAEPTEAENGASDELTPTPEAAEAPEGDAEAAAVAERDKAIEALDKDAPRMYLSQHYVTLKVGESFDRLSFVEEITDTADDRSYLFRYISVQGEVNVWQPGTYELKYHATDSNGNLSNEEVLTVTVEE